MDAPRERVVPKPSGRAAAVDAVEPENRLVARALGARGKRSCAIETVEQELPHWRGRTAGHRCGRSQAVAKYPSHNLKPRPRRRPIGKRIVRLIMREVVLDQRQSPGQVWLKIVWQTGAAHEHHLQRRVHTYRDYIDIQRLRQRESQN